MLVAVVVVVGAPVAAVQVLLGASFEVPVLPVLAPALAGVATMGAAGLALKPGNVRYTSTPMSRSQSDGAATSAAYSSRESSGGASRAHAAGLSAGASGTQRRRFVLLGWREPTSARTSWRRSPVSTARRKASTSPGVAAANEAAAVVCVPGPPREGATRVEDDEQPTVKQGVP